MGDVKQTGCGACAGGDDDSKGPKPSKPAAKTEGNGGCCGDEDEKDDSLKEAKDFEEGEEGCWSCGGKEEPKEAAKPKAAAASTTGTTTAAPATAKPTPVKVVEEADENSVGCCGVAQEKTLLRVEKEVLKEVKEQGVR